MSKTLDKATNPYASRDIGEEFAVADHQANVSAPSNAGGAKFIQTCQQWNRPTCIDKSVLI